jgi:hypothetical protein
MPEFVFRFGSDAANRTVNVYDQSGQLAQTGTAGAAVNGEVEYTATLASGIYVGEVKAATGWVRAARLPRRDRCGAFGHLCHEGSGAQRRVSTRPRPRRGHVEQHRGQRSRVGGSLPGQFGCRVVQHERHQ